MIESSAHPTLSRPSLTIICPMKNEAGNIDAFFSRLRPILESVVDSYEILCVNDGSSDDTLSRLLLEREKNPHLRIVGLLGGDGEECANTS